MDSQKERQLGSDLTVRCGRPVKVVQRPDDAIGIVLEPVGDRGRLELSVGGAGVSWRVSDRGVANSLYGLDLDFVVEKLTGLDADVVRDGDEIVTHSNGRTLAETIADFVESVEFVPVLAGLFANDLAA